MESLRGTTTFLLSIYYYSYLSTKKYIYWTELFFLFFKWILVVNKPAFPKGDFSSKTPIISKDIILYWESKQIIIVMKYNDTRNVCLTTSYSMFNHVSYFTRSQCLLLVFLYQWSQKSSCCLINIWICFNIIQNNPFEIVIFLIFVSNTH